MQTEPNSPVASIVIPTFDRPRALQQAVESALSTTLENCEVVVVDDRGSRPAKESLVDVRDPALTVVLNERSRGPSGARNHGVRVARGQTIFFLDDDDTLQPEYLTRTIEARIGEIGPAVFGFSAVIRDGQIKGPKLGTGATSSTTPLADRLFPLSAGAWVDRAAFLEIGGLDESLRVNEDTEFCLAMATAGYFPFYDGVPGVRIDGGRAKDDDVDKGSITNSTRAGERAAAFLSILNRHASLLEDHPEVRRAFAARVSKYLARDGRMREAMIYALRRPDGKLRSLFSAFVGAMTSN